jgi:hypothetical protein
MLHRFLSDQKFMYSLLMKTVAGAVIDLTRDWKYLGATPGILMVLHTWTGQMHCRCSRPFAWPSAC